MNDTRVTVSLNGREIILIGTAHVSRESIDEVSRIIREEQPDMVCVELDEGRYKAIAEKEHWETLDLAKVFREGKGFLLIVNLVLSGFQRRIGAELGVKPGEEMKTAVDTALDLGVPYSLCDREVQITLRRAWTRCGLWSKCKLLASLLAGAFSPEKPSEEEIENLKKRNELEGMMTELAEYLPEVKETLIDERDRYLAAKIWTSGGDGTAKKQVAVVGAGHLPGIKAHLEKLSAGTASPDVSDLDKIPAASSVGKIVPWALPVFIVLCVVLGFIKAGPGMSLAMLFRWVLLNGSLAALGALIALGHPLSVLVSFIGAPIGTISPIISVGFFSGLAEVSLRKPRVSDTETIAEDALSLKGIYRNRITKALLVFFLSSLGGAVGNVLSIPSLASLLF
ncbi:MAG: TraB/GumN family protein [Spirochaetaceae bacterium]|jgi:pheromone shutdown-related protein TraB|nr:TraB/GumN family protein [Spirochaetaceae bacterium]